MNHPPSATSCLACLSPASSLSLQRLITHLLTENQTVGQAKEFSSLQAENLQLKQQNQDLHNELDVLKRQNQQLQTDLQSLAKEIEKAKSIANKPNLARVFASSDNLNSTENHIRSHESGLNRANNSAAALPTSDQQRTHNDNNNNNNNNSNNNNSEDECDEDDDILEDESIELKFNHNSFNSNPSIPNNLSTFNQHLLSGLNHVIQRNAFNNISNNAISAPNQRSSVLHNDAGVTNSILKQLLISGGDSPNNRGTANQRFQSTITDNINANNPTGITREKSHNLNINNYANNNNNHNINPLHASGILSDFIPQSVIECGRLNPRGERDYYETSSFWSSTVEIFTASSDGQRRILYKAALLSSKYNCPMNGIGLYLSHRQNREEGVFQATGYLYQSNSPGLRFGDYFLTLDTCKEFETYLLNQQESKKTSQPNKTTQQIDSNIIPSKRSRLS